MGTLTAEGLTDEIRDTIGRGGSSDEGVITDVRVARWLNEGQRDIAENCVGLPQLDFKCASGVTLATDTVSYALSDFTNSLADSTDEGIIHVYNVWHLDGANSIKLDYKPQDEFDEMLIDPTSSDHSGNRPTRWTRRFNNIQVAPRPSSDYNGDYIRLDGMRYPEEFTTNDATASELPNADEGLIMYGIAKAWGAIGGPEGVQSEQMWKKKYTDPHSVTGDYGFLQEYQDKYSRQESWDLNLFN